MGDVTTGKSISGSTNKAVNDTTTTLATKLGDLANNAPPAYGQSLYAGSSPTTQNAWAQGTNVANNVIGNGGFSSGQQSAMSGLSGLTGAFDQNAPGYQAMRQNALNDAVQGVTAGQMGSGMLGSRSYIQDATKAGVNAIAPIDYQNYQNNINNQKDIYGQQFQMGQQGLGNQSAALAQLGAIGSSQDADMAAQRQGAYDLYMRQTQAPLQWYQGIASAANGNAAQSQQQQATSVPWWQAALGGAATIAGTAGNFFK